MNFDLVFMNFEGEEVYTRVICEDEGDDLQTEIQEYMSLNPYCIFLRYKRITCTGCLDNAANQEAHMFPSGCLYNPELED